MDAKTWADFKLKSTFRTGTSRLQIKLFNRLSQTCGLKKILDNATTCGLKKVLTMQQCGGKRFFIFDKSPNKPFGRFDF